MNQHRRYKAVAVVQYDMIDIYYKHVTVTHEIVRYGRTREEASQGVYDGIDEIKTSEPEYTFKLISIVVEIREN